MIQRSSLARLMIALILAAPDPGAEAASAVVSAKASPVPPAAHQLREQQSTVYKAVMTTMVGMVSNPKGRRYSAVDRIRCSAWCWIMGCLLAMSVSPNLL